MEDIFAAFNPELVEQVEELIVAAPQLPAKVEDGPKNPYSIKKLAQEKTQEAFDVIVGIMNNVLIEPSTRLEAAKHVLDRGWGKATVQVKSEQITYTLKDAQEKLLEARSEVDERIEEARRVESERLGQYITVDAEVIEDAATHSSSALQNHR